MLYDMMHEKSCVSEYHLFLRHVSVLFSTVWAQTRFWNPSSTGKLLILCMYCGKALAYQVLVDFCFQLHYKMITSHATSGLSLKGRKGAAKRSRFV